MKILKLVVKYLSNFFIGVLVLFCFYAVFSTTILKKSYVSLFDHTFFIVASGSMTGTINVNDVVVVEITNKFKVNDIITYTNNGYFVTHRILSLDKDEIVTKGDVNNSSDDPITYDKVVGKVVYIFPFTSIFQVLGAIMLITVIIVIFNFDKIFKLYIFKKTIPKIEEPPITKVDMNVKAVSGEKQEYSKLVLTVLNIMKERSKTSVSSINDDWYRNLKYVTKMMEIVKIDNFELLQKLVEDYKIGEIKSSILPGNVIIPLRNQPYTTYGILLLNAIIYNDRDIFNILFYCVKYKVNNDPRSINKKSE